jgi:transposase InsO family protein
MTQDDVLFGYRLQLFDLAARTTVAHACRTFGVHRSTYYRWKAMVERSGLEMLRPRERRRPQMPNQLSPVVEQRIVAFALGNPGLGPRRISAQLARAGYRAAHEPPREPAPELHVDTSRPGELVGLDCFFVGRLHGAQGPVWQITAIDTYSSFGWADLVICPPAGPTIEHTSALACRVAAELQQAGWRLERVLTDNGNEFGRREFAKRLPDGVAHSQIRSGRPQTNGHVERLHRTILEECWRPAFARFLQVRCSGLRRHLDHYLHDYNHHRAHTGRKTAGRCPADLVYAAHKMEPR